MAEVSHPFMFNESSTSPALENKYKDNSNNNCIRESDKSSFTVHREYIFPIKIIFLIRQINLLQKLRNHGVTVSFAYADSDCNNNGKLILKTTTDNEAYILDSLLNYMTAIDHCGCLSERIRQYMACYDEARNSINRKLQDLEINAGIAFIDESLSVIATNSDNHSKAIAILQQEFSSDSIKVIISDLHPSLTMDRFLSLVKESIPESSILWLETELDSESSNYMITATGPRELVYNAIQIIKHKQQDHKVICYSITDICVLKTEFIRLYRKHDILTLEEKYECRIEIETIMSSEIFTSQLSKSITIKCIQLSIDEVKHQINRMIGGIIIEKKNSISLHSRIGKLYFCNESKSKFIGWQNANQCLLTITDHYGHRYV